MEEKPHACDRCGALFTELDNFLLHKETHRGEPLFVCSVCKAVFTLEEDLKKHLKTSDHGMKDANPGIETEGTRDIREGSLFAHVQYNTEILPEEDLHKKLTTYSGEKPYVCAECERSFSQNSKKAHCGTHACEKLYKCDQCGETFRWMANLDRRMKTHSGEKPFQCRLCEKSFTRKESLSRHLLIHTGEKPHKCDLCKKSFASKQALTRHMLTHKKPYIWHVHPHTGEKSYKC